MPSVAPLWCLVPRTPRRSGRNYSVNAADRAVRTAVYVLFAEGRRQVGPSELASATRYPEDVVTQSLGRLAAEHRLLLEGWDVVMAHPFSGVDTGHYSIVEDRVYWANCAWDALAILALLGDGDAVGPTGPRWTVVDGRVTPHGLVNLVVPARSFWEDVGFT